MSQSIVLITFVRALLLVPVAWWQQDVLVAGLAGLIPFFAAAQDDRRINR